MARDRSNRWDEDEPKRKMQRAPFRKARGAALTLAVISAVLYAAALAVGRTDGFRALLTPRIEQVLGFPVKVDRVSLDLRLGLTMRDVRAAQLEPVRGAPFTAERIDIWWRWSDLLIRGRPGIARIEVVRPIVHFEQLAEGGWRPASLNDVGAFVAERLHLAVVPTNAAIGHPLLARLQAEQTALSIRKADMAWWRDAAAPVASAEGLTLFATPIALPGRTVFHILLKVARAVSAKEETLQHIVLESIDGEGFSVVLPSPTPP